MVNAQVFSNPQHLRIPHLEQAGDQSVDFKININSLFDSVHKIDMQSQPSIKFDKTDIKKIMCGIVGYIGEKQAKEILEGQAKGETTWFARGF